MVKPTLRRFEPGDFAAAHRLSVAVGWPHRLEDWRFALDLGEGTVAERRGAVVGTCAHWHLDDETAAVGLLAVAPDAQGAGIGRRLLRTSLDRIGAKTVLLNATDEAVPLYLSEGFSKVGVITQRQGTVRPHDPAPPLTEHCLVSYRRAHADDVATLDRRATGLSRLPVLAAVAACSEGAILERNGRAVGYAFFRRFGRGQLIGPMAATSAAAARMLVDHWLRSHVGDFVRIDVHDEPTFACWLDGLGLEAVANVTPMVRGCRRPLDGPPRYFALVSHALC